MLFILIAANNHDHEPSWKKLKMKCEYKTLNHPTDPIYWIWKEKTPDRLIIQAEVSFCKYISAHKNMMTNTKYYYGNSSFFFSCP